MQSNGAEGVHRLKGMKTCPSSRIFILRYFLVTRLRVVYTAIPLFLSWMRLLEHVDRPLRMIFSMNTPLHSRLRATPRNFDRFSHLFSPFFPFFLFFFFVKRNLQLFPHSDLGRKARSLRNICTLFSPSRYVKIASANRNSG